ncbi:CFC1 [Branchiostoma lanceolatum]|uniref:CFC1 protein n=1 Tax=Branchiostoma lanceolatum TaxID=7740 RepID=A0A8J9YYC3_BRALA|nr:CFC1 [Branchiostoma lanceolatum]
MKTLLLLSLLLALAVASRSSQRIEDESVQENARRRSHPRGVLNQPSHLIRAQRQVTLQEHIMKTANHSDDCCENGGTCILGSFCMCPGNFTGRYCEQRAVTLPCGDVPHNDWMFQGCSLCRCGNGTFLCIEHMRPDCESERDVVNVVNSQDNLNTLSVMDLFDQSRNSSSSARGLHELEVTLLVSLLATITMATVVKYD